MDAGKLFQGIAIIIDDEVNKVDSSISVIKQLIEEKHIPVLSYERLPELEVIPSLSRASFIILDWDYFGTADMTEDEDRLMIPSELQYEEERSLLTFIEQLLQQTFMPIFVFTRKPIDEVKEKLYDNGLLEADKPQRIFVQQKDKVSTEASLFSEIETWLKEVPSVYALKEWESVMFSTKTSMFRELFAYSPNWAKIVWDMIKEDSKDNHKEFGDFITRLLVNRILGYSFDDSILTSGGTVNSDELAAVVEGEKYISYCSENTPSEATTGDLYLDGETYYLNIRAQCDMARKSNPEVYLIKGKEVKSEDIETSSIRLTSEQRLHLNQKQSYTIDELREICSDEAKLMELNSSLAKQRNEAFFISGNIIGKKSDVYITCIAGKKVLRFRLDIAKVEVFNKKKDKRIGRILPPYITCIQQSCASYITREGTLPTPVEVFSVI